MWTFSIIIRIMRIHASYGVSV